jgi:uncharacterized protein involved in response to NO
VSPPRAIDPYRVLFPLGVAYAAVGASLWPLYGLRLIPYPGPLHWTLMIQGFEHCFILGFLLTALPSFMHSDRCHPLELALAVAAVAGFGAFTFAGAGALAQASYVLSLLLVPAVVARRLGRGASPPPTEFLLVGLAGGVTSLGVAAGRWQEPAPRFGLHLISQGMMLSLVLGIGGLLVPTFSAMREPLVIPGLARPHERGPRRILYAIVGMALVSALVLDARGLPVAGAAVRAVAGTAMILWVWKVFRLPGARDAVAWTIWSAGWLLLAGLVLAALLPVRSLLGFHLGFIGGFGLLTLGIATRVVVRHGGHRLNVEGTVLNPAVHAAIALALVARISAELNPARAALLLSVSGTSWTIGWGLWARGALPRILRLAAPGVALRPATPKAAG